MRGRPIRLPFGGFFELDFQRSLNSKNMGSDAAPGRALEPQVDGTAPNLETVKLDMLDGLREHRAHDPKLPIKSLRLEPEQLRDHERHRPR